MQTKQVKAHVDAHNNTAVPALQGLTPNQLQHLLYDMFTDKSPVQFNQLADGEYDTSKLFEAAKFISQKIAECGELKLTAAGNLPTKVVKEAFDLFGSKRYKQGSKIRTETDYSDIHIARIILELSGVLKKRSNKFSLTKKGEKVLVSDALLYSTLMQTYCSKYNWTYFTHFSSPLIGTIGCGFSLYLLHQFGSSPLSKEFYAEKYFTAFPTLVNELTDTSYHTKEEMADICYKSSTFSWLNLFGLVELDFKGTFPDEVTLVTTTKLFDKLILILN